MIMLMDHKVMTVSIEITLVESLIMGNADTRSGRRPFDGGEMLCEVREMVPNLGFACFYGCQ